MRDTTLNLVIRVVRAHYPDLQVGYVGHDHQGRTVVRFSEDKCTTLDTADARERNVLHVAALERLLPLWIVASHVDVMDGSMEIQITRRTACERACAALSHVLRKRVFSLTSQVVCFSRILCTIGATVCALHCSDSYRLW